MLLRDGSTAVVRPFAPADLPLLEEMVGRLSRETIRLRFHSAGQRVAAETVLGAAGGRRFIAMRAGEIVGAACYIPLTEPGVAELAVVVSDQDHGHGVGMRLVERLAESARAEGLQRLLALVMIENRPMLNLLTDLGFEMHRIVSGSEYEVMVDLGRAEAYAKARDARDHVGRWRRCGRCSSRAGSPSWARHAARHRSVTPCSRTSSRAGTAAGCIRSTRRRRTSPASPPTLASATSQRPSTSPSSAFPRDPFSPQPTSASRRASTPSSWSRPASASPRPTVPPSKPNCAVAAGPPASGWSGPTASASSNRPGFAFDATFARTRPPVGNVAISSQSGAVGIALLEQSADLGIGVSSFVSVGNRADVSPNDLLETGRTTRRPA